jgi:hypothetical protein
MGRVYQNCLLAATLIEKPAPTNLLMRMVQDVSFNGLELLAMGLEAVVGEFAKPNPPAPFPTREGGAKLPSPKRRGVGGGV